MLLKIKIMSITSKILILITVVFFVPTQVQTQTFYGNQSLNPLIKDGKSIINLPSGHQIKGGELVLKDVLGRKAFHAKKPFSIGSEYEPKTATNNVQARQYDDSTARWLSVDREREDSTPYSYVGNNPINFVDIDGNTKYSLWLYSQFGVSIPDGMTPGEPTIPSLRGQIRDLTHAIETTKLNKPLKRMSLESPKPLGEGRLIDHITLTIHGSPLFLNYYHVRQRRVVDAHTEQFVRFFLDQLEIISPESKATIETIFIDSCGVGCNPSQRHWLDRWQKPFLDKFAKQLMGELPNLKSVTASPYQMSTAIERTPDGNMVRMGMFGFFDMAKEKLGLIKPSMSVNDYVNGKIPAEFFNLPDETNLEFIGRRFGGGLSASAHGVYSFMGVSDFEPDFQRGVSYLAREFKFNLPIFRRVQVRQVPLIEQVRATVLEPLWTIRE